MSSVRLALQIYVSLEMGKVCVQIERMDVPGDSKLCEGGNSTPFLFAFAPTIPPPVVDCKLSMVCAEINETLATTGLFIGGVFWYVNVVNKSVHRGFFYFFLPHSLPVCLPIFNYTNCVLQLLLAVFFCNFVHGFGTALSSALIQ